MNTETMLNVGALARELKMQPVDLVRELLADGVAVLPVSSRSYRVEAEAFHAWREQRRKRLADRFQQSARKAEYVRGPAKAKRRAVFTR